MTDEQMRHCAEAWERSRALFGECVPYVYMVDKHVYFLRNMARRAAYIAGKQIERMSANECYGLLHKGRQVRRDIPVGIEEGYEGALYQDGRLFSDNIFITYNHQQIRIYESTIND